MHLIAYTSERIPTEEPVQEQLDTLVAHAQRNNQQHNVTGALFYHNGNFMQVLEGEETDVKEIYQKIQKDSRHKNIITLIDTPVQKRGFSDWSMQSFNLDDNTKLAPEVMLKIRDTFVKNLLPRSDLFVQIYEALLKQTDILDL